MVHWEANNAPFVPTIELGRVFHKWEHYLPIYERSLARLRTSPGKFLEIGVAEGGSLAMWQRFFAPGTKIVGIDIDPKCRSFDNSIANVHVRIGSQADEAFLHSVIAEFGPFDAILDDGSHQTSHQVDTFKILFECGLANGGVYLVEDIHTNYWPEFCDGAVSFVDFVKHLIDVMHAHYQSATNGGELLFRVGDPRRRTFFDVPLVTTLIDTIEIHDSVVVVQRSNGKRNLPRSIKRPENR
jgi:SAM-dependent methyltransferase